MFKHVVTVQLNGRRFEHDHFTPGPSFSWNAIWAEVAQRYGKNARTVSVSLPYETFNEGGY